MYVSRSTPLSLVFAVLLTSAASAQLLPPERTYDLMVADGSNDVVVRLADLSQNGKFASAGEFITFYDDLNSDGAPALNTPASMAFDASGGLFIADTGLDAVLRAFDADGDGQARLSGLGEWSVYFDNANASGVTFTSVLTIVLNDAGVMWGANSGTGAAPLDFIFRAEDLNSDGDAQDAGEITIVYDSVSGAFNIAVPFGVAIDPANGDLLVSDVNPDAIYRLSDLDSNGDYYGVSEVTLVYDGTNPTSPGLSNANRLRFAPDGSLLVNDATLDMIIRLRDLNTNGSYDDANEATIFADQTGNAFGVPANQFDIQVDENGVVWACENSALDGIIRYEDLNNDGDANDPGETTVVYDTAVGPGAITQARSLALVPAPRMMSPAGSTILIGSNLTLEISGFAGDAVLLLLGVTSLGGPTPVPPYGTLGFIPLVVLPVGQTNAAGELVLTFPVPVGTVPSGLQVFLSGAVGKPPYRQYLSDELLITFQ